jgi:hypothetical protein
MNPLTTARAGKSAHPLPAPVPLGREISSTYLAPADPFPSAPAELELVELHVLHSRITRQLESEYIDPAGPHPVTLDRAQELAAELDTRQDFLAPRSTAATDQKAASTRPAPAAGHHSDSSEHPAPATTRQDEKASSTMYPAGEEQRSEAGIRIHDLAQLRPGEPVQLWYRGQLQCVGWVEEASPALGVVWIREGLDAYRRMIHPQDGTELRSAEPHHGR